MGAIVVKPVAAPTTMEAKTLFNKIDTNHDNSLSIEELMQAATSHGDEIRAAWPKYRIRATIAAADTNQDGRLSRNEFSKALTALVKEDPGTMAKKPHWYKAGGGELDAALAVDAVHGQASVRLVDAAYIVKLASKKGALLPRRQDLPESAFLSHDQLKALPSGFHGGRARASLRIIVVSHAWLQPNHPDPHGETLRMLAKVLIEFTKGWRQHKGGRYGVFLDFCSIFQKGRDGEERTSMEAALFKSALSTMSDWYSHPRTFVLKFSALPPGYPQGFEFPAGSTPNTASYDGRGWCFTESSVANLVKEPELCLDLGQLRAEKSYTLSELINACSTGDVVASFGFADSGPCLRAAPLTLDDFTEQLEEKSFTSKKADIALVAGLYAAAFKSRLGTIKSLDYAGLNWRPVDVLNFNKCVASGILAANLMGLNLTNTRIGDKGAQGLAEAMLADCLPQLKELDLTHCDIGNSGFCALVAAMGHVSNLSALHVGRRVGDEGATALAAAMTAGLIPKLAHLELEDLVGNLGMQALCDAFVALRDTKRTRLEYFVLGGHNNCRLTDAGLNAIAAALEQGGLQGMRELQIERSHIHDCFYTDAAFATLATAVEKSGATLHIRLGSEEYREGGGEDEGRKLVEEALRANRAKAKRPQGAFSIGY